MKASDGAPLGTDYAWNFTTQAAPPPDISSTTPNDGDIGVSPSLAVQATFTRPMDPKTITTSSFRLRDSSGALVPADVSYNLALQRATLAPSSPLAVSGTYTARTSTTVSTALSVGLPAPYVWSFTVADAPPAPPTVTSFAPPPERWVSPRTRPRLRRSHGRWTRQR